jgi:hypothetical protein
MIGHLNFLLGFVAGLRIIVGLAPLRNPASYQLPGVPRGRTLETEDEFERARR